MDEVDGTRMQALLLLLLSHNLRLLFLRLLTLQLSAADLGKRHGPTLL